MITENNLCKNQKSMFRLEDFLRKIVLKLQESNPFLEKFFLCTL